MKTICIDVYISIETLCTGYLALSYKFTSRGTNRINILSYSLRCQRIIRLKTLDICRDYFSLNIAVQPVVSIAKELRGSLYG